jgi:hypothetical protein
MYICRKNAIIEKNAIMEITNLLKGKLVNVKTDAKVIVQLEIESAEEKHHSRDLAPATRENDWWPPTQDWSTIDVRFTNGFFKSYSSLKEINLATEFSPNNLSNIFKNINHKPCNSPGVDYAWDVTENGKFVGELFYSKEFREWDFIKDNYPSPRRAYKTSFPMNVEKFVELFQSIGIKLDVANV